MDLLPRIIPGTETTTCVSSTRGLFQSLEYFLCENFEVLWNDAAEETVFGSPFANAMFTPAGVSAGVKTGRGVSLSSTLCLFPLRYLLFRLSVSRCLLRSLLE